MLRSRRFTGSLAIWLCTVPGLTAGAKDGSQSADLSARSSNFAITSYPGGPPAQTVLRISERLRDKLQETWLNEPVRAAWQPRCEVVLHAERASYLNAVGRDGGQTSGSSLVNFQHGRVVKRRIDVLVDSRGETSALAHELTHVILADQFDGRRPPRWLDEGLATLADSAEKRALHRRDCQQALRGGSSLRLIDILRLEQFTSAQQVPAFYGQSLALVDFLAKRDDPTKVVEFTVAAMENGYDFALKRHYAIDGVAALEREWREHLQADDATPSSPFASVGFERR